MGWKHDGNTGPTLLDCSIGAVYFLDVCASSAPRFSLAAQYSNLNIPNNIGPNVPNIRP